MEPEIQALIDAHAPYLRALDDGKVECTLNGHAFAPRKDVIEAFLNGKKFQKLKKRHDAELDLGKYKPFLSDSLNFSGMLFCSLTNQLIAKDKGKIEAHVGGRRYQTAKARHEAGELELWVEPTPEDLEAMEEELMEEMQELADLEDLEKMEAAAAAARGDDGGDDGDVEMEDDGNMVDAFLKEIGEITDSEAEEEEEDEKPALKKKAVTAAAGGKKGKAAAAKAKAKPAPKEKKKFEAAAPAKGKSKRQSPRGAANGKPAKKARK